VASQHFARTPTAQKFGLRDLDWFFRQWVYSTGLPTYQLEWQRRDDPDGSMFVTGTVRQDNVGADWQMVLPLVLSFDGGQEARTTVRAEGQSSTFELKVPARPRRVDLDPHQWVLSERTTSRGR
jgi:aminopeptidase N